MRATKIVATLGPACDAAGVLEGMVSAGMDVARLNASHSTRQDLTRRLAAVRAVSEAAGRQIAVMLDLGGPKVRLGEVASGTTLEAGATFVLRTGGRPGDARGASVTYPGLAEDVSAGDRILVDDGAIELRVTDVAPGRVGCEVVIGGALSSHKGVDVPGVRLSMAAVTPKDREDLEWGMASGVDLVAQSFVRDADDVADLRSAMGEAAIPVVAKIEKREAVEAIGRIVEAADAVMVARGDLGVETSPEQVPVIQRRIVSECRRAGKPVIVATQMLESMVHSVRPTRAEASDVANAVFDGVDAVMLSEETAIGEHPIEAIETMASVCVAAEAEHIDEGVEEPVHSHGEGDDVADAVSAVAADLAERLSLAAVVTATESGATARSVAARRPPVPILAITPEPATARRLAIVRGVLPRVVGEMRTVEEMADIAVKEATATGLARAGDIVVLTAGVAVSLPGTTDLIRVLHV